MLIPSSLNRSILSREHSTPKTALGFFAGVLAILTAGAVLTVGVIATQKTERYLIPWILLFVFALFFLMLALVACIVVFGDPTKLMLGQISGSEYREYQEMVLGDSAAGERPAFPKSASRKTPPLVAGEGEAPHRVIESGN